MDTTDSEINFDAEGGGNHCHQFDNETRKSWLPNEEGKKQLEEMFNKIKQELRKDKYYIAKKLGVSVEGVEDHASQVKHNYTEYPKWDSCYVFMKCVQNFVSKVLGRNVKNYS